MRLFRKTISAWKFACVIFVLSLSESGTLLHASSWGERLAAIDLPVMAAPVVGFSPETNWEFGAGVAGFFHAGDLNRRSYAQMNGAYTLNHQWYISVASNLYLPDGWFMQIRGGYRDYPDYWYGIGNGITEHLTAQSYNSRRAYLNLQPQYRLTDDWSIGLNVNVLWEKTQPEINNNSTTFLWGLGAVAQYDSRDDIYYPHHGLFFKTIATGYLKALGCSATLGTLSVDLRQFLTIYKELLFAWQLKTDITTGNDIPFQMLSTIGGQDLLRGVRRQMFRDDMSVALQGELRFPIWDMIRATVFAGIGDVYNLRHWQWAIPKVSYGAGVRVMFNAANVNIRFDVARSNVNPSWKADGWSFYLTCIEAF